MGGYRRRLGPEATASDDPVTRDVDEEIAAHLEMRASELEAQGLTSEEARREAMRRFGADGRGRSRVLAEARRGARRRALRRRVEWLAEDLRSAVGRARRHPGFSLLYVVIMAGALGMATTVFTLVDHLLLRPLPFHHPHELVALWSVDENGSGFAQVSMANWVDWKEGTTLLEGTALYMQRRTTLTLDDQARRADVAVVTGEFFEVLKADFDTGRPFTGAEAQSREEVAVVSAGLAQRLGASPNGARLDVDGRRVTVVGVVAPHHAFPAGTDVWLPTPDRAGSGGMRNNINWEAVGRLRPDATPARVQAELSAVADGIRATDPEALYSWGVEVHSLRDAVVGPARAWLVLLGTAVLTLLLAASANLAGLTLARARRMAREGAVRVALGAPRGRILQRLLTEHVLLTVAGALVGLGIAAVATEMTVERLAGVLPRASEVVLDWRVGLAALFGAVVTGLGVGLLPSLAVSRADPGRLLNAARGGVRGGRGLPGSLAVGGEVALAVALLVVGALLLRSFQSVMARDLGYEPAGVVVMEVDLTGTAFDDPDGRLSYWDRALGEVRSVPGGVRAGLGTWIPTAGGGTGFIEVEGRQESDIGARYRVVSSGYFETLGIEVLRGRVFTENDGAGAPRVTVINRTMAQRYWPDQDPLGQRVRASSMEGWAHGGTAPWLTVVGVVDDVLHYGFEDTPAPEMYVSLHQAPGWSTRSMALVVAAPVGSGDVINQARGLVQDLDPTVAVETSSLEGRVSGLVRERRAVLAGITVFGLSALLLVSLGVYGLMAYAAAERTRELAIRSALGARRTGLVRMMLGSSLRVTLAGCAAGLVLAYWLTALVDSMLVGVAATDAASYVAAGVIMLAVGTAAAYLPSVRATRHDPLVALRSE